MANLKRRCTTCGKPRDIPPARNPAHAGLCIPCRKRPPPRRTTIPPPTQAQTRCTIVIGPPAAGKTTWVKSVAQQGDLIIDLDAIIQALGINNQPWHEPSRIIARAALNARTAAARIALTPHTDNQHSYLIHAVPTPTELIGYKRQGAAIHVVDPGRQTVMDRIATQRPAIAVTIAERWYARLPSYSGIE